MATNSTNDSFKDYIGYSKTTGYVFVLLLSCLSITMNMIFIIYLFLKKYKNKTKKKISSLEQILSILSISEICISFLWFISAVAYPKIENMKIKDDEVCNGCKIIGIFQTFFYIFDWVLSSLTMYHLKNMILNPLVFILKPSKKIFLYITISGGIAVIVTVLSIYLGLIGKSPMITCFLTLDNLLKSKDIAKLLILFIIISTPLWNIIYFFIQAIIIIINPTYQNDKENKTIFKDHCIYTYISHIMSFLMTTLYIIYYSKKGEISGAASNWYFYLVILMICSTPFIVCLLKLIQTGILQTLCKKLFPKRSKNKGLTGPLLKEDRNSDMELDIEQFESVAVKKFVMDIYISVCYCLEKAHLKQNINPKIEQSTCNETNEYKISKSEMNKDLSITILPKDIFVKSREDFNISCVEYAPSIFSYLRKLDLIKDEEIINSLLPMNNKNGIKDSEGRGGSFFLNTDDNEFSLKTITFGEAELIRGLLLCSMAEHISNNPESIIGRIYGVYKISMKTGFFQEDEIYFILMKNVIGSFNENLICKYDLKGSTLNREANIGEHAANVMKDNNFRTIEQVLLLNKTYCEKLLEVANKDANFFCDAKVMDYSLLVAKISLNKDEIIDLFGNAHRRQSEIDYFNMMGKERQTNSNDSVLDVKEENNNSETDKNEEIVKKNIRYNRDKIKPLRKYFFPSLKGDVLYIIAIIDFFQLYNIQKTLETQLKLFKKGVTKNDISSMPPEGYKERFISFVKSITDTENYIKKLNDPNSHDDF